MSVNLETKLSIRKFCQKTNKTHSGQYPDCVCLFFGRSYVSKILFQDLLTFMKISRKNSNPKHLKGTENDVSLLNFEIYKFCSSQNTFVPIKIHFLSKGFHPIVFKLCQFCHELYIHYPKLENGSSI